MFTVVFVQLIFRRKHDSTYCKTQQINQLLMDFKLFSNKLDFKYIRANGLNAHISTRNQIFKKEIHSIV